MTITDYAGIHLTVAGVINGLTGARRGLKAGEPCLMAVVC
jgi:hypothetical protein